MCLQAALACLPTLSGPDGDDDDDYDDDIRKLMLTDLPQLLLFYVVAGLNASIADTILCFAVQGR